MSKHEGALLIDAVMPGTRVGPWVVDARLAAGGSGTVYRAHHGRTRAAAAVKLLHAELAGSREAAARFAREVRAARRAHHPGLARILGSGVLADGRPWFAMELLEGRDLSAVLRDHGAFDPDEALAVLAPLADVLAAAHARGVIHRDVKASNVFLADEAAGRRVVLLDFGVAKLLDPGDVSLTTSRHAVGTPSSMAPEQTSGGDVDERTDVYGLGVLAFHLLTGQLPFSDSSPAIMRQLHRWARRPRPSQLAPVPPAVDDVIVRAMAREPAQRPATVTELVAGLQKALAGARRAPPRFMTPSPVGPPAHLAICAWIEVRGGAADVAEGTAADDDADEAAADAFAAALPRAAARLAAAGFVPAVEMGNAALWVKPCAGARPTSDERRAAIAAAIAASRAAIGDTGPRAVCVRVRVHLALRGFEISSGGAIGGAALRLPEWVPADDDEGVTGTLEDPDHPTPSTSEDPVNASKGDEV